VPAQYLVGHFPRLVVRSTFRSISEQVDLWNTWVYWRRRGLSDAQVCALKGVCTPARPGRSLHNYGRAFDLNGPREDLLAAAQLWKRMGGRWFASDPIHFES
jgi:LAS superfamily LD-carboxypeptidase LdcB